MALSTRSDSPEKVSRPFDRKRNGFVMGEGAAVLVLEELEHAKRRGAHIYCEIAAYQTTCDAYHQTASDPQQQQAARAIREAIQTAGIMADRIDYISAHGTSTPINDRQETFLIKKVFGNYAYSLPISSIKSMVGHSSGAAGAMQAISCALAFEHDMITPTINYEFPDPECDLDYVPNEARPWNGFAILQNTFGFAGKNSVLIYKRYEG
jgi:3-oxoacyl-[acyl-carrier-protein] synthase II